jgi:outer membrane protein OmpA-like peptidoglycan-associated protein
MGIEASFEQDLDISTVENKTIDKDLSKFRAILRFDYDSAELSAENQALLKQLGALLPEGATISVLGSADDLGSGLRNEQLTKQRASNTQAFINKNFKGKFKIETDQSDEKVSEDTPQGRFINRCIIITVKD